MRVTAKLLLLVSLIALLLNACNGDTQISATPAPERPPAPTALPDEELIQPAYRPATRTMQSVIAGVIDFPVAMAFTPDGRLFITEKGGNLRLIVNDELQNAPVITLPTDTLGERGLLGIAIDPDFESNHYIWLYHTAPGQGEDGLPENRVVRFTERDGVGFDPEIALVVPIQGENSGRHNGGNIHFGPDGMLYVTIGDNEIPAMSQDPNVIPGKIHRFVPGVPLIIPDDNPLPNNSLYAYGLRNSFDFTFDPLSGAMLATENGPECDDEINLILPGGNYGWGPDYQCGRHQRDSEGLYDAPLHSLTPPFGLTGIIAYEHGLIEQWQGKFLYCAWNTGGMYLLTLNEARDEVVSVEQVALGNTECRTTLTVGPAGRVYYAAPGRIFVIDDLVYQTGTLDMGRYEVGAYALSISEDTISALNDSSLGWVKIQHQWQPGASGTDVAGRVIEAHNAGFKVLLNITGPPDPDSIDYEDFIGFVRGAATIKPDAIEVWSEMNLPRAWPAGEISAADYVEKMLAPAYDAIKSVDPNIMVISAAPAPTGAFGGCTEDGCDDSAYIEAMVAAGAEQYIDCAGMQFTVGATAPSATSGHPADGGDGHYSWYYPAMSELYANTFVNSQLCVTALGYLSPEGYDPPANNFFWASEITPGLQAQWLAKAVELGQATDYLRLLILFNVDFKRYSPDNPQAGYAMLRPDGTCPACEAIGEVLP